MERWLKRSTHTAEGHVFCGTSPAVLLQDGSSRWDRQAGKPSAEICLGDGVCHVSRAWTTSVQLWCPHWVIPKSHYRPSQHFPSWGTSLFPKARGIEMLVMVAGGRGEHSSLILIILAHPAVKRMQCVQGLGTFRCRKVPLKTPGSHIVERQRCLWLNGLGLSDRLILVGCWWFGFSLFLIWGPSWII